ncbi:MAG: YdcF family protein [Blastocatellia bacterium]|nr:YdcF family protein [Blastocatellia bacterium]
MIELGTAEAHTERTTKRRLGGLLVCKYRWGLSLPAKLLLLLVVLGFGAAVVFEIYPFLAVTQRVDADVLVVEGWMHPYGIRAAVEEFRKAKYERIFTTGGPVVGKGGYINDWNTSASVGAEELKRAGIAPDLVQMVPSRVIGRDRTYSSAVALREWWSEHGMRPHGINIVTEDTHARRSRLLFQKALGADVKVGVIAVSSPDFDARHWWQYSEAVEEVIGETLAYAYATLFFHPTEAEGRWNHKSAKPTAGELD